MCSIYNINSVTGIDDGNESAMEVTELHVASPVSNDAMLLSAAEAKLANMTKEREIFLRAALQLLDKREHNVPQKKKYKNPFKLRKVKSLKNGVSNVEETMMDVIRFGSLRKANRYHRGVIEIEKWKKKFIELRHGMFSYENENIKWLRGVKKKVMLLSAQTCKCRVFQLDGPDGNKVFELTLRGGPRRLWLAESSEERDGWVKAINTAMSGSAGDSGAQDLDRAGSPHAQANNAGVRYNPERPVSSSLACALSAVISSVSGSGICTDLGRNSSYISKFDNGGAAGTLSCPSCEGAAAPYASAISRYNSIQSAIGCAMTSDQCRDITCAIVGSLAEMSMIIPVQFVKRQMNIENFAMSTQDSLTAKTLQSVTSSQVWKDLQRDSILINNVLISGENEGPEAMIGCLVRTILDKAQLIRRISKDYHDHMALRKQRQQRALSAALRENSRSLAAEALERPELEKRRSISFPAVGESESEYEESVRSTIGENPTLGDAIGSPRKITTGLAKPALKIKEGITAVVDTVIGNINSAAGSNFQSSSSSGRSSHSGGSSPPAPEPPVFVPSPPPAYLTSFEITEGQVLACARDMLVLCNRTQSGGDTYFCIDALLCNHEHCILTPVATEHESPLEITVDIVEGQAKGSGRRSVKTNGPLDEKAEDVWGSGGGPTHSPNSSSGVGARVASGLSRDSETTVSARDTGTHRRKSASDTSGQGQGQSSPRDEERSQVAQQAPRRPLSVGSSGSGVGAEVGGSSVTGVAEGPAGLGLVASRLPGGPVASGANRHTSIYSTASSTDRVLGSSIGGGHYIHSATTSVSGEDNSSAASVSERPIKDTASVISSTGDRLLIPLTAKSLQQLQHRPGVAVGLPPAVDISSVNSKPQQSISAHSASVLVASTSAQDLPSASTSASVKDGEGGVTTTAPRAPSRTLSRSNSDAQSQCSRSSNVSLHSVHSLTQTTSSIPNPEVNNTPGMTPANFIVEDEDCMSPFLRKPQFPYALPAARANRAQAPLPGAALRGASSAPMGARGGHADGDESSSSSSDDEEEKEHEDEYSHGNTCRIGKQRPNSLTPLCSHTGGSVGGIADNGVVSGHSRDESSGSERSHSRASVQAQLDPQEPAEPPSNAELEDAEGQISNYVGGSMCIRVQVRAVSKYRLCTLDPQDETTDTWATVTGEFEQCFFIKSNCNGRPAISDRLVKLSIDNPAGTSSGAAGPEGDVNGLTSAEVSRLPTLTPTGTAAQSIPTLTPPALPPKPGESSIATPSSLPLPPTCTPAELTVGS